VSPGDQAIEPVVELAALVPVQSKFPHELFESGSALGLLLDLFEDCFIGEHRDAFKNYLTNQSWGSGPQVSVQSADANLGHRQSGNRYRRLASAGYRVRHVWARVLETWEIYNAGNREKLMENRPGTDIPRARQRRYPRVRVNLPAEAKHVMENFPRRGQISNVSEGGAYIEMVQTLEPPTCVDVVLWLNNDKILARAEVVTRNAHLGNGIRFIRMSEEDKKKLRDFIEIAQKSGGNTPFRRFAAPPD
jgi:hypothetical protein